MLAEKACGEGIGVGVIVNVYRRRCEEILGISHVTAGWIYAWKRAEEQDAETPHRARSWNVPRCLSAAADQVKRWDHSSSIATRSSINDGLLRISIELAAILDASKGTRRAASVQVSR